VISIVGGSEISEISPLGPHYNYRERRIRNYCWLEHKRGEFEVRCLDGPRISVLVTAIVAQEPTHTTETKQRQRRKEAKAAEANGYGMIDDAMTDLGNLRLPGNRVRTELTVGGMLWKHRPRACSTYLQAGN